MALRNMSRLMICALLSGACSSSNGDPDAGIDPIPPVELVDPVIGTGGRYFGFGSAFMGACLPHGMAKPGPNSTTEHGAAAFHHFSGYHAEDDRINGFGQVHISGTGAVDYGALLIMPTAGFDQTKINEAGYLSTFRKETEQASPGFYAVHLDDPDIQAEITATLRTALYRFTYSDGDPAPALVVDPSHALPSCSVEDAAIEADPAGDRVTGWVLYKGALTGRNGGFHLYFDMRFSRAATVWSTWLEQTLTEGLESAAGPEIGMGFTFAPSSDPLLVKVGLSYVDVEGATKNLDAEQPGWDFEGVLQAAQESWSDDLNKIKVEGGSRDEQVMFYTGIYHSLMHPTLLTDVDGRYTGFDKQAHTADGWSYYTDFSMWDTYRCTHSLYTLMVPERHGDMLRSLLTMYEQGGHLPKWAAGTGYSGAMIGTPADVILAEAAQKGVSGFDQDLAYQAVVANAVTAQASGGRAGVSAYLELGYVPAEEVGGSAARTLEFGVADGAIASWAATRGETDDAQAFTSRSKGYVHLWDPAVEFLRGKNADGSWVEGDGEFQDLDWDTSYYTEGTAWQYLWLVPHDPLGLADLFGSVEATADKLELFFATPEPDDPLMEFLPDLYYWHGNEPDIHAAYLFDEYGRADRTQYWVREIFATRYGTGPDGLDGNDDLGTMSAWYVFSAAGFYPNAGQTRYWIGSPLFSRTVFDLGGGKTFQVIAEGASAENLYVQSARLNGEDLEQPWFDHADLAEGGTLELIMGPQASAWGR